MPMKTRLVIVSPVIRSTSKIWRRISAVVRFRLSFNEAVAQNLQSSGQPTCVETHSVRRGIRSPKHARTVARECYIELRVRHGWRVEDLSFPRTRGHGGHKAIRKAARRGSVREWNTPSEAARRVLRECGQKIRVQLLFAWARSNNSQFHLQFPRRIRVPKGLQEEIRCD